MYGMLRLTRTSFRETRAIHKRCICLMYAGHRLFEASWEARLVPVPASHAYVPVLVPLCADFRPDAFAIEILVRSHKHLISNSVFVLLL
jgi:hypothetical protein